MKAAITFFLVALLSIAFHWLLAYAFAWLLVVAAGISIGLTVWELAIVLFVLMLLLNGARSN
jgi:hypothetical protein